MKHFQMMAIVSKPTLHSLVNSLTDIRKSTSSFDCPFRHPFPSTVFIYSDDNGEMQLALLTTDGDLRLLPQFVSSLANLAECEVVLSVFQVMIIDESCIVFIRSLYH